MNHENLNRNELLEMCVATQDDRLIAEMFVKAREWYNAHFKILIALHPLDPSSAIALGLTIATDAIETLVEEYHNECGGKVGYEDDFTARRYLENTFMRSKTIAQMLSRRAINQAKESNKTTN